MPALDFAAVRARIPLADVLDLLDFVPCESSGDQVRGPCPVHHATSAKSRSFSANLKRNIYKCFKCGSFGNQLDLDASATGLSLFEAALALCQQLDREIPWMPPGTRLPPRPAGPLPLAVGRAGASHQPGRRADPMPGREIHEGSNCAGVDCGRRRNDGRGERRVILRIDPSQGRSRAASLPQYPAACCHSFARGA